MSEEKKELQLAGGFSLQPKDLKEAMEFAKLMADSELVPKDFRGKPGNVLIAVQMGAELGVTPMQSIQNIAVINGRPSIWGDLGLAVCQSKPYFEWIKEDWDEKTETATCSVKRRGDPNPATWTFSMADARRIIVTSYKNGNAVETPLAEKGMYKNYPRRMCQMRARWFALRDKFSDALKGMMGAEESYEVNADVVETTTVPMPKRTESAPATDGVPKAEEKKPEPQPPAEEPEVEATVTIEGVKKFSDGHFEVSDAEGVVYATTEEGLATAAKDSRGKPCAIAFKPQKDGRPTLTKLCPVKP